MFTLKNLFFLPAIIFLSSFLLSAHPQAQSGNSGQCQNGEVKKIENPPFNAHTSCLITRLGIKAGSQASGHGCTYYSSNTNDGCYKVEGIGTNQASASRVGHGKFCPEISHIKVYCDPINTPTPTVTPTPTTKPAKPPTPTKKPHPTKIPKPTHTPKPTKPPCATPTQISTPTSTPTSVPTPTSTQIPTVTPTPTNPPAPTSTPTPQPHSDPTATPTPLPTSSPAPVGGYNPTVVQVLGSTDNYNPLIDAIKKSLIGQVLGENNLAGTSDPKASNEKLPSSNLLTPKTITIPQINFSQPIYQSDRIGDELLVGHNEVLEADLNGLKLIYGHNSPQVFANLYQLNLGQSITIDTGDLTSEYQIVSKHFVHESKSNFFESVSSDNIVLMTCSYTQPDYRHIIIASKI